MYYYIYQITNNINNHFYIGRRKSKVRPEDDPYFGSGLSLKAAILKYGKHNFSKTILHEVNSFEELVALEQQLVNLELVMLKESYNQALGGPGGGIVTDEIKQKLSKSLLAAWSTDIKRRKIHSLDCKLRLSKFWIGKTRTSSDRLLKSIAAKKSVEIGTHAFKRTTECPHCGKVIDLGNAKKWHFDKCKLNPLKVEVLKVNRTIMTPQGEFTTIKAAAKQFELTQQTILNRCLSANFTEWYIIYQ